jgi:hypothetical protein
VALFTLLFVCSGPCEQKRGTVSLSGSGAEEAKIIFHSKLKPIEIMLSEVQNIIWSEVGTGMQDRPFVLKIGLKGSQCAERCTR